MLNKQQLSQNIIQKLSPQQIELIKLIELPVIAFEEYIINEVDSNPVIEYNSENNSLKYDNQINHDDSSNYSEDNNVIDTSSINIDEYLSDDEIPAYRLNNIDNNNKYIINNNFVNIKNNITFYEYLKSQLSTFKIDKKFFYVGSFIIDNLDEDGYLRIDVNTLIYDIKIYLDIEVSCDNIEYILTNYIHLLDPKGVGARDLRECLCIQLKNKNDFYSKMAYNILKSYFKLFIKKNYLKIISLLKIDYITMHHVIKKIVNLSPKPGKSYMYNNFFSTSYIIPDFYLDIIDNNLILSLHEKNKPKIIISNNYLKMLSIHNLYTNKYSLYDCKSKDKKLINYINNKLKAAKWFIEALKQRERTLKVIMEAIISYQKKYFFSGNKEKLKPMVLKNISKIVNLDISTVSRVVSGKYIQTPYGIFLIKNFFSEGILNDKGIKISTIGIKKKLLKLIDIEDKNKPLNDRQLVNILKRKGYCVSRRTIAKYRQDLNIPSSRLRVII